LDLDEEFGQTDTHAEGTSAVRITVFEAVGCFGLVGEALIALGNEDELGLCFGVTLVAVRMVLKRQFSKSHQNQSPIFSSEKDIGSPLSHSAVKQIKTT
jgi:hypothetical protein